MNAPEKATEIKAGVAAVLALLTSLWGWTGWAVIIWIGCIILDYISGSAAASSMHRSRSFSTMVTRILSSERNLAR